MIEKDKETLSALVRHWERQAPNTPNREMYLRILGAADLYIKLLERNLKDAREDLDAIREILAK